MKMHVLSGGRLQMKQRVYQPDADREALIELPVSCYLLRHPQGNVLFDTGCHPAVAENAEARWGGMAKVMRPIFRPEENVVTALSELGLGPDDVDLVVNSHFHSDHCGCNEFFRRSSVICHRLELEAAQAAEAEKVGYLPVDWRHPMPIEAIDGEHDVFGDGRLVLLPLPGHTPGAIGALVGLDHEGSFLLASDAAPLRLTLEEGVMPRNTADADAAANSLDRIRQLAAQGTTVLYGHDPEQWQALRKGADAYR